MPKPDALREVPELTMKCERCDGTGQDYGPCYTCSGTGDAPTEAGKQIIRLIRIHRKAIFGD